MGSFSSKNKKKPEVDREELIARLRVDPDFLSFQEWAKENNHEISVDEIGWLHHNRIEQGFSCGGVLSIDDRTSWERFKNDFMKRQLQMRRMIEDANDHYKNGITKVEFIKIRNT